MTGEVVKKPERLCEDVEVMSIAREDLYNGLQDIIDHHSAREMMMMT